PLSWNHGLIARGERCRNPPLRLLLEPLPILLQCNGRIEERIVAQDVRAVRSAPRLVVPGLELDASAGAVAPRLDAAECLAPSLGDLVLARLARLPRALLEVRRVLLRFALDRRALRG